MLSRRMILTLTSTTLCLLHRAHMPPATSESNSQMNGYPTDAAYPSRNIAFQAAGMITSIIEHLQESDELKFTPAFMWVQFRSRTVRTFDSPYYRVYSLFSALIMHVYQMRSSVPSVVSATQERLQICMNALKEVSKVWLVAKMVHTLFESILGNKVLEDRLQKAAGKRHKKPRMENRLLPEKEDQQQKRKFDDMELGFANGPPAPQVSYERSRPQTPAVTPSRDLGQSSSAPMGSLNVRQSNDAFMGSSRSNTRPPTPFNPSYSIPATPPDLYLVTRESPHISQNLWENFQPDQLFPESTNIAMPPFPTQQNLDPQLQMSQMQPSSMLQPSMQSQQQSSSRNMQDVAGMSQMSGIQQPAPAWQGPFTGDSPEDSWSSSSRGQGPVVPTALNVEDW